MSITFSPTIKKAVLVRNAQNILRQRYNLQPKQTVLVIYDQPKERIGRCFVEAGRALDTKIDVFRLKEERFNQNVHQKIAEKINLGKYSLFINILEFVVKETKDRIQLHKLEEAAGGAVIHCPGIEENMLQLPLDFKMMGNTANALLRKLRGAEEIKVQTLLGTNLRLKVQRRQFRDDVLPKEKDYSNFPCGEIYCAPHEDSANGCLIVDGSGGDFGIFPQPLRLDIKNGKIENLEWLYDPASYQRLLERIKKALFQDDGANTIGELGIGLAAFSLCGNMLQDEKVLGTIHIAFGNNDNFGGQNHSNSHIDFLVKNPRLTISFPNKKLLQISLREAIGPSFFCP